MTTPKISFKDSTSNFIKVKLNQLLKRYSESNLDAEFGRDDILSLSSIHGIVDRKGLLDDTYDKVNHLAYKKCKYKDFVYGKSISATYPYGLFKVNNCKDGLLSTLYYTFKVADNVSADYLDSYFSHLNRTNNFLRGLVLVGDRYITAESEFLLSGTITIHSDKNEQQKIADFFTTVDEKINLLKKKKELLEQYKKGVMQKIFSQELKFKDEEGKDFPEWEEKELGEIATITIGEFVIKTKQNENGKYPVYNGGRSYTGLYDQFNNEGDKIVISARGANAGFVNYVKNRYWAGNSCYSIGILNNEKHNTIFVFYYLKFQEKSFIQNQQAANIPSVSKQETQGFTVKTPIIFEQQKIADFLSALDDKIAIVEQQINKTELWKKGLLQQMFV